MKEHIKQPLFRIIAGLAEEMGLEAFIVGGYVRDLILDRPSKDLDIVVSANGIGFATALSEKLEGTHVNLFKRFGTAQFMCGDLDIEVVGARKESYRSNSRNPEVSEGSLEEDRARRDFTINALSISLNNSDFGSVIDPFNGLDHLEEGLLVTPLEPEKTYSDDPLRMMRAVRFAAQLGFRIEDKSYEALSTQKERIKIVSQERITEELNKIIASKKPSLGFKILFNTGILHIIFPKMIELYGVEKRNGVSHKDNFYHTLQVLDNTADRSEDLWLRWSAILHDIAKPDTKRFDKVHGWTFHGHEDRGARMVPKIFKQLKLPLDSKMKFVQKMVKLHLRPIALSGEHVSDSGVRRLIVDAGDDLNSLMTLCESDITSKNESKVHRYLQNFQRVRDKCEEVEEKDKLRNWEPPIGGAEIMNFFDLEPGRIVGELKAQIRESILDGEVENNLEDSMAFLLKIAEKRGLKPKKKV
ncbi:MAG TPA: tRNA nucleotidyltransferase [Flavobacteriales bacterium]|nr:tRNA nucleotidyltransferase [Flavobacteriales bacterium]